MAKLFGDEWFEDCVPLDLELTDKDIPETSFGIITYRNAKLDVIAFSPSAFLSIGTKKIIIKQFL